MILFVKNKNEKQYHRASGDEAPHINPKKGWRKGMKYTTWAGKVFVIDSVDAEKRSGELRLHVTRVK